MNRWTAIVGAFLLLLGASAGLAQDCRDFPPITSFFASPCQPDTHSGTLPVGETALRSAPPLDLDLPVAPPRMAPDLALSMYLALAYHQLEELGAYSDVTTIEASLPDTRQHGIYELRRSFQAPKSLAYAAVRFVGDGFVKNNVIVRLLQSEVDQVHKGEGQLTAIITDNYKFSFKGVVALDDGSFYDYQVKPRHQRPGLFKGHILVDPTTGHLRRAEGTLVKSPSFFVKKVEFVQDYAEYGQFSLPVHLHSVAKARLVGRAVVDIFHHNYMARTVAQVQAGSASSSGSPGGTGSN